MKLNNFNFYKKKHFIFSKENMEYDFYFNILYNVFIKFFKKKI